MKNLFKNKILFIFLIFLFLVTSFTNVFADSNSSFSGYYNDILFDSDVITSSLPNGELSMNVNNYIVLYDTIDCKYFLWTTYGGHYDTSNFYIIKSSENSLEINCDNAYTIYYFDPNSMSCCYGSGGASDWYYSTGNILGYYIFDLTRFDLVISNFNLYTSSDCLEINNSFFHLSPLGITGVLVETTMKAQVMEQMKIMIVGFLKYLIVFVISLIAFWKGWHFLSMQLKKA